MPLLNGEKNNSYKIISTPAIGLVKAMGLRPGIALKVQSKQPFGGPIVVKVASRSIAIAEDLAEEILIEEVY